MDGTIITSGRGPKIDGPGTPSLYERALGMGASYGGSGGRFNCYGENFANNASQVCVSCRCLVSKFLTCTLDWVDWPC